MNAAALYAYIHQHKAALPGGTLLYQWSGFTKEKGCGHPEFRVLHTTRRYQYLEIYYLPTCVCVCV